MNGDGGVGGVRMMERDESWGGGIAWQRVNSKGNVVILVSYIIKYIYVRLNFDYIPLRTSD